MFEEGGEAANGPNLLDLDPVYKILTGWAFFL